MRLVNYEVRTKEGNIFTTTNFEEATKNKNRIVKTFLTEYKENAEETRKKSHEHALKVQAYRKAKRG